jgi:hypothetical protein
MATFTLSVNDGRNVLGNRWSVNGVYTGPASYPTGGDPVTAASLGLSNIRDLRLDSAVDAAGANARALRFNPTTSKIQWFVLSTNAEVANAVDLSGFTANLFASGR